HASLWSFRTRPSRPTRMSTLFPYTTLFRSYVPAEVRLRREQRGAVEGRSLPGVLAPQPQQPGDHHGEDHQDQPRPLGELGDGEQDRKSTRLNSSHQIISYAVFCLKKKKITT